ncbi:MAG: MBL fold metallo-hydrolase [Phycisphaera sp.]|nr:MAG: MBL fold metallo-hydrolase [Phycisphaera sp.]
MEPIDISGLVPEQGNSAALWTISLGPFESNTYVYTPDGANAWVVDPGLGPKAVIDQVKDAGLGVTAVLLTHAHADHILGLNDFMDAFAGTPLLIHEAEKDWPSDPALNLSAAFGTPFSGPEPTRLLQHGQEISIGDEAWTVRHTPGHSPGGCVFVAPGGRLAIVGDTLFSGSVGRTDFPGGDFDQLADSIRREIYSLDGSCLCLPGHGPTTTVAQERSHNPFVRR